MVLFMESKPQDIVETEMQSLNLNSITPAAPCKIRGCWDFLEM